MEKIKSYSVDFIVLGNYKFITDFSEIKSHLKEPYFILSVFNKNIADIDNEVKHLKLLSKLKNLSMTYYEVESIYSSNDWSQNEISVIVCNKDSFFTYDQFRDLAMILMKQFETESVMINDKDNLVTNLYPDMSEIIIEQSMSIDKIMSEYAKIRKDYFNSDKYLIKGVTRKESQKEVKQWF